MKPTKITVSVNHFESDNRVVIKKETAVLTTIMGHEVYILESAINGTRRSWTGDVDYNSNLFREDGERVWSAWTYGRSGKALRWACVIVNTRTKQIMQTTNGMNGATNHGRGATLRFIDWDGTKYAEALETAKRTGKKLLHAF